jgi:probable HAF family extracellular repeat protein
MGSAEFSYANAISGDGAVIAGARSLVGGDHAFAWSAALGMVDLNTYLPSVGVDLTGWTLTAVRGISFDGSSMVGYGTFNGADRAFLVRGLSLACPALCAADFNCSHALEVQDIFSFLTSWFALDPRADFNSASGITPQDIFDFLAAWFSGC